MPGPFASLIWTQTLAHRLCSQYELPLSDTVECVCALSNGWLATTVVTSTDVTIWQLDKPYKDASRIPRHVLSIPAAMAHSCARNISCLVALPDVQLAVVNDRFVKVWDVVNKRCLRTLTPSRRDVAFTHAVFLGFERSQFAVLVNQLGSVDGLHNFPLAVVSLVCSFLYALAD